MACVAFTDAPSSASSDGGSSDDLCYETGVNFEKESVVESQESPQSPVSPRTGQRVRRERTLSLSKSAKSATKTDTVLRTRQRTIYTSGRPPWYDTHGQSIECFVIGICGGSASGKTTVAQKIIEALDVPWVTLLSLDSFYKVLNEDQHRLAHNNEYNFDHPESFDLDLLVETLRKLKEGKRVEVPIYNFVTHSREKQTKTMYGANVIICEGILIFANKTLVDMMDMKVFIDTDSDIRLARRLRRDITERGRDLEGVIKQYNQFVKPMFDFYI
ncbi:unnamed protein product, partial [Oppiella nova]